MEEGWDEQITWWDVNEEGYLIEFNLVESIVRMDSNYSIVVADRLLR